jgi:Na+-translocating ferredoxin:NAD+ oxidoreductase subunit G
MDRFKFDREQLQMVVALVAVAVVAVLFLGLTDMVTREPIAAAQREALNKALLQVLPEHSNDPLADAFDVEIDGAQERFFPARDKSGAITSIAWETAAPDGYSGTIRILMGLFPDGTVNAIRVTDHRETPGLGDGITKNQTWIDSFIGKHLNSARWAVKKDGGDFDQFTGATITPRAVVKAVKNGLKMFAANRDKLLAMPKAKKSKGDDKP